MFVWNGTKRLYYVFRQILVLVFSHFLVVFSKNFHFWTRQGPQLPHCITVQLVLTRMLCDCCVKPYRLCVYASDDSSTWAFAQAVVQEEKQKNGQTNRKAVWMQVWWRLLRAGMLNSLSVLFSFTNIQSAWVGVGIGIYRLGWIERRRTVNVIHFVRSELFEFVLASELPIRRLIFSTHLLSADYYFIFGLFAIEEHNILSYFFR